MLIFSGDPLVDCGAICMGPRQMLHYQKLVDDAVIKGAKVLAGGFIPPRDSTLGQGSFYPPTVLVDVPEDAFIAQEEIFGPIMAIFKVVLALLGVDKVVLLTTQQQLGEGKFRRRGDKNGQ